MSDFTTTLQDSYRELCIQVHGHAARVGAELRRRTRDENGQTAAEYMGILLIVAVIIGALFASGIGDQIVTKAKEQIDKIASGEGG
jgi:Flp pilus assembly pilin Flp